MFRRSKRPLKRRPASPCPLLSSNHFAVGCTPTSLAFAIHRLHTWSTYTVPNTAEKVSFHFRTTLQGTVPQVLDAETTDDQRLCFKVDPKRFFRLVDRSILSSSFHGYAYSFGIQSMSIELKFLLANIHTLLVS